MSTQLLDCFDRHARERPRHAALIVDDEVHTWGDLHAEARRASETFSRTLAPDAIVAVISGMGASAADAWIGVIAALRSQRRVMLLPPRLPDRLRASITAAFRPDLTYSRRAPAATSEHALAAPDPACEPVSGERAGLLLFSSGTTGRPRAILRSAAALDRVASTLHAEIDFGLRERVLSFLPMHHAYGLEHALLAPILGGATVEQRTTSSADVASLIIDRAITILPATPILLDALAGASGASGAIDAPDASGGSRSSRIGGHSLRRVYSAGTTLPARIADRMRVRWGVRVDDLYGASELGTITISDANGPHAVRGVALRVVDPDVAHALIDRPTGEPGEFAVRSDAMFDGYVDARNAPPQREHTIDGFFRTGDLGVMTPEGPRVVGRLKLQYDVGGLKVNAEEVERVLQSAPGVAHAIVIPMAITETLQRLRAVIEPQPGAVVDGTALAEFAREHLAPHEVPRRFEIVDELPRTASGKLLRGVLMERDDAAP